jgi:type I restriction enzyme M protein
VLRNLKLKPTASQLKQILDAVSWRDPEAKSIVKEVGTFDNIAAKYGDEAVCETYGYFMGGFEAITYEADAELRDTENIPLTYEGGIGAYFHKEVLPHVPDAWIDESKTVIGYEISFNKYFYVHQPLRDLAEVVREIRDLETETEGLLEQILNFSA